ncbi:MAG: hypothetical protein IJ497_10905, partial [Clostridia bacterium]|nr:hypothetical protein [Clostridia bacterium]
KQFERYNWIHAYPNVCNEIIALYYGNGDFEKTLYIIITNVTVSARTAQISPPQAELIEGTECPLQ